MRAQLEPQFRALTSNSALVVQALDFLEEWLSNNLYAAQRDAILGHIKHEQYALLLDSFYQIVPFGTGGRRGRVGYGPNRINPVTVAMSVQGHCNFLRETEAAGGTPRIVVAFDTRVFSDIARTYAFLDSRNVLLGQTSRSLAHMACEIYAGNGFEVYVVGIHSEREYLSTPELSFAIRYLEALGGMNVSASHNHPDDNGFKFFNEQGAQDVPPKDQAMTAYMGEVQEIKRVKFADAVADGQIRALPADLHTAYVDTNLALRSKESRPVNVVYTPLCGTGNGTVGDVLRAAGYKIQLFEPHSTFDGTFASVPFRLPNPEVPAAASPALRMAKELNADMVLSTDPDADRIGVFAKDARGNWRYLNGNEIASILTYYLCLDGELGPKRKGLLIKTLVTTRTMQRIAEKAGCPIVSDLLVGFKYIAYVLYSLEREGRYDGVRASPRELVIAGEESHGLLLTPKIRDKDAAGGALMLCELLSQLRAGGKYLPEYLDALALECGNHQNAARSMVMRGIRGVALLADMMESLRSNPPAQFGGMPVLRRRDFLEVQHGPIRSETEKLSRNLLVYELESAQIVVRPSGTEPKAKIYVDVEGSKLLEPNDRAKAAGFARDVAEKVMEECIGRVGFRLSASANLLPDTLDLDLKAAFDTGLRAELPVEAARLGALKPNEQLEWLRERLSAYGAGSDPLEAAGPAVIHLLGELRKDTDDPEVSEALHAVEKTVAGVSAPVEWVT